MMLFARAGERVYGTRTNPRTGRPEDFHACTVRHDLYLGELPDFPACLGDWQQVDPPVARHFHREIVNVYSPIVETRVVISGTETSTATVTTGTATATETKTTFADLAQHGGGEPPQFGVLWSGESWWRPYEHEAGGDRASLHYDLRFRSPTGTCTWRMDELNGSST